METHSSLKAQLAEYAKFADHLVAKYGQDPPQAPQASANSSNRINEISSEEKEAVRVVLQFIQDMYASLLHYHDEDVILAGRCTSSNIHTLCNLNTSQTTEISDLRTAMMDKKATHATCRNNASAACSMSDSECQDYDHYRKDTGEYANTQDHEAHLPGCVSVTPEATAAFSDSSIQTGNPDQLRTMEICLQETKRWLDPLYDRYELCTRDHDLCSDCEACEDKQEAFESAHCRWYEKVDLSCQGVNLCGTQETDFCKDNICENIGIRNAARIADNETGQRLVCLLHVIFGKPMNVSDANTTWQDPVEKDQRQDALARCKQGTYQTPAWDIPCDPGEWQTPAPCDTTLVETCSDAFMTAEYRNNGLMYGAPTPTTCSQQNHLKYVEACTTCGYITAAASATS